MRALDVPYRVALPPWWWRQQYGRMMARPATAASKRREKTPAVRIAAPRIRRGALAWRSEGR